MIMIMTDNDYDKAIVWCKKKIENVKKYHILSGKRLEGYEEAMLCVMSYLHCEKERSVDMTNADRIRAMTDDELNELFNEIYNAGAEDAVAYEWGQRANSFEWTMDWLQQPAK